MQPISLLLALVFVLLLPSAAMAQARSEPELRAIADEAVSRGDYAAAVASLELLVRTHPESNNEQVFWDLGKLCDTYGLDYEKAVGYYRLYAERFPQGRFRKRFDDRLAWLDSHRADWDARKRLTVIQSGFSSRPPDESIAMAERLLQDYPQTTLKRDIHGWLAAELFRLKRYAQARSFSDLHVASFSSADNDRTAHVRALDLHAKIALQQRDFSTALDSLQQIGTVDGSRAAEFSHSVERVRFEWRAYRLFVAAAVFALAALVAAAFARPWRAPEFKFSPRLVASLLALVLALTTGPYAVLRLQGYKVPLTFFALAAAGVLILAVFACFWPLASRIGRKVWYPLACLFVLSVVYSAFYVTDMTKVLTWPWDELQRHGPSKEPT